MPLHFSSKDFGILDLNPPNNPTSHYGACHFGYNLALTKVFINVVSHVIQVPSFSCKFFVMIFLTFINLSKNSIPYPFIFFLFRTPYTSTSHYTCAHTLDGSRWFLTNDSGPIVEVDSTHVKQNCVLIFINKGCVLIFLIAF